MSFFIPPVRHQLDGSFPDGAYFARLSRLERLGDGSNARTSLEFDAIEVDEPKTVCGWITATKGDEGRFGLVRIVTTTKRFANLMGAAPVEGRWYELRLAPGTQESRPWTWFTQLEQGGYTSLARGSLVGGAPLDFPDGGDVPPGPRSLGAAATAGRVLPSEIATACRLSSFVSGTCPDPLAILGAIVAPAAVCVRDVGQASFVTLKSARGECLLHFDVGSPVAFNRHTIPPQRGWPLVDPPQGQVAPVILSHWDWDHLHAALQLPDLQCRPWIVPNQPLGPGAARLARTLAATSRLAIWPGGNRRFPWGILAECIGGSSNNASGLAALVHLWSGSVLLTGDAPYLAIPPELQASPTFLVATHHGGRLESRDQPPSPASLFGRWIVSCGRGNTYRHPHQSSLDKHIATGWGSPVHTSSMGGEARGDRVLR
jgi:competence protein ComEC